MPQKCVNQLPTARIRVHSPHTGWRGHRDKTLTVKGETDYGLFTNVVREFLSVLGYDNPAFFTGFLMEAINNLPEEYRRIVAVGVVKGLGLSIEVGDDGEGNKEIYVSNVERYPPLVGDQQTESGLVLPEGAKAPSGLVLPGK